VSRHRAACLIVAAVGLFLGTPASSAGATTTATTTTTTTTAAEPPGTPTAQPFAGLATVGPLFLPGSTDPFCTASVVASRAGDLLVTAAHCVIGATTGYTFAPGDHDGVEPFGSWTVVGAYAAPAWIDHEEPQADVAFLTVAPKMVGGRVRDIESVTGADRFGTTPATGQRVTVPAYALGATKPVTCSVRTYVEAGYPAFNCNPYPDGTSGAPWLRRIGRGWAVVGVIGGLHQGGCQTWTSYSPRFAAAVQRAYVMANRGTRVSTFPPLASDGCATGV